MFIRLAVKEAEKARHRHRLGAVLLRGGRPVSVAHNHSHVHAEHAALDRAWRSGTSNSIIVVVRLRRDGTLGMAKPCKMCTSRLIEAGVKKVVYSDFDGTMKTMKLSAQEVKSTNVKSRTIVWNKEK